MNPRATVDQADGTWLGEAEGLWVTEPCLPHTAHGLAVLGWEPGKTRPARCSHSAV